MKSSVLGLRALPGTSSQCEFVLAESSMNENVRERNPVFFLIINAVS